MVKYRCLRGRTNNLSIVSGLRRKLGKVDDCLGKKRFAGMPSMSFVGHEYHCTQT